MLSFLSRYWFTFALVILLLLAIPGFVLFFLNVFGLESPVNAWLEQNFHLTYHLSIPWWGALVLLLLPVALLVLYFLKLKRKPLSVPSTFLWKKSIEDLHVNSLLQWLRQNVLLLLQILALLGLIYGVMAFHLHGRTTQGKYYILMIDNSASMSATDMEPSRLEWAKQEALKEIDASSDNDFGMVVEFNASAEIRQSYTSNRHLLRDAVRGIQPTQKTTRIDEALALADTRANPTRSAENEASRPADEQAGKERTYVQPEGIAMEVHLFSDGRFPPVPEFALGNLNLHYHAAGQLVQESAAGTDKETKSTLKGAPESRDNVALVAFNASRQEEDPRKLRVFVKAASFRDQETAAAIQLEVIINGKLREIRENQVTLPGKNKPRPEGDDPTLAKGPDEGATHFDLDDLDERLNVVLHARLLNVKDRLPLDNEAWLVMGIARKARVLLVGNSNPILEAFFNDPATRKIAAVTRMSPADLDKDAYRKEAQSGAFDLVLFDRCAPKSVDDLPRANTFFIGNPPPPWGQENMEKIENPPIKGWMNKDRVLRYLTSLHEIGVGEAFKLKDLPPRTPRLIESSGDAALLLNLNRGPFTDLVLTFALIDNEGKWNTNWPNHTSFPIFMINVLHALGNLPDTATEESVKPGQIKTIRPELPLARLEVIDPEGTAQTLNHEARDLGKEFTYGNTDQVGLYQVKGNEFDRTFAVNLLDPEESDIEPKVEIQIGSEQVAAGQDRSQPHEVWRWFVALALIVLLVEWYIYNRRVFI